MLPPYQSTVRTSSFARWAVGSLEARSPSGKEQENGTLRRCGGQDSNLRTDKEWDLNPPPLTKLGDPRANRWQALLDFKPPMRMPQAETTKPVSATMLTTSSVDKASVVTTVPELV